MLFVVSMLSAVLVAGQAPAASSAHISGRVFAEGANTPIAGARVMLMPMRRTTGPLGPPPETSTDQDGRYAFQNLAPGSYRIDAQHAGFAQNINQATTMRTIDLAAGQALNDVDIWLPRGGAVAGRIVDPTGAPLAGLHVMVMRRLDRPGFGPRLLPVASQGQQTNDLGEFRLYDIAAGTYYIAAAPPMAFSAIGGNAAGAAGATALATTFYPGVTDSAAAQPVAVTAGETASNTSFTMQVAPVFRVSGVVIDESGNPVGGAMVMLMSDPQSGGVFGPAGRGRTEDNGRFVIGGVPAGRYRATAAVPIVMNSASGGAPNSGISGGVTGGVVYGAGGGAIGAVAGSAGVSGGMMVPPTDVVVADANVTGLRIVVHRR